MAGVRGTTWLWLCLLVPSLSPAVTASAPVAKAERLFAALGSFQADFEQEVIDTDGRRLQQSSGRVAIQRPGRFRWDYEKPYRQLIVADGKQMWIYDEDLEQVTVSALDASLEQTPALLLSRHVNLEDNFSIRELPDSQGLQWLSMLPKDSTATYSEIRLGLHAETLRAMELVDGFGQVTHLRFSAIRLNRSMPASLFHFSPPPGTDIIYGQDITPTGP